jgi:hypothetical protein
LRQKNFKKEVDKGEKRWYTKQAVAESGGELLEN